MLEERRKVYNRGRKDAITSVIRSLLHKNDSVNQNLKKQEKEKIFTKTKKNFEKKQTNKEKEDSDDQNVIHFDADSDSDEFCGQESPVSPWLNG